MDPVTHAAFGVGCALAACPSAWKKGLHWQVALAGLAGGLLPDADVFLKSATDELFSIEYHRHFTHSFLFSPVVAALGSGMAAALLWRRRRAPLGLLFWAAWIGTLSHLFCDLWTSYGTRIWWPFADTRAALHWVSVVDPLVTLPLLVSVLAALFRKSNAILRAGLVWLAVYLALSVVQQQRAQTLLNEWVQQRGGDPKAWRATVKPAFGNILLWRALAREDGELHVFGIRCGLGSPSVIPGQNSRIFRSVDEALQALQLPPTSLQARDVRRFFHFSGDWVGPHPLHEHQLMDLRYAMLPHQIQPLWGIQLDPSAPEKGAQWIQQTGLTRRPWAELWQLIMGRASLPAD